MGEICEDFERALQREKCLTEKCSCSQCDSLSCFEKRDEWQLCACENCEQAETYSYFYRNIKSCSGTRLSPSYQYAAYLKPVNPVTERNLDEFIQDDMIYESDRDTILDANRPPPTSIHDYTARFLTEKVSTDLKYKSISLNEYIDKISGKDSKNKLKYMVKLKEMKPSDTPLQPFETRVYDAIGPSQSTQTCSTQCTRKSKVENGRNYETDRETVMEVNQPPSLGAYIDKISQNSNYKIKENALDMYINQLKHAKRPEPLENTHYSNGNNSKLQNSYQNKKQSTLDNYINQLKHVKRSEPLENITNSSNGNCCESHQKVKLNTLENYVNQLKHAKPSEPLANITHTLYSNGNCSESQHSHQKIKQNTLDDYINQLKHAKRSEPLENITNYPNGNCSQSQNCHQKAKQNTFDNYVNQSPRPAGTVESNRNYETDRETVMEVNQTPSLSAYIDKISRHSNYKIKENVLDIYINQLKHTKRSEPSENIISYYNGNYSESQHSHQKIEQNTLDNYVNQLKHANSLEPLENNTNFTTGNCSQSQNCHQKTKQNTVDNYVNQSPRPAGNVESNRNYETDRETVMEVNQTPSLSAYIDKISRHSNYKIKENMLDIYINQLKHTKRSEPLENMIRYYNGNYSESHSHQKMKQNALDKYVNQLKHAKRSEPFENTLHFSNGNYNTSPKMRSHGNYSASESPKRRKRHCIGQCKKEKCSYAQSEMVSCPLMSQSRSKFSNPSLNTCVSCKELSVNKNNNYFDIFQKLMEIYKICRCKVCECIGPKIIRNEICSCKPCDCPECSRFVGAINCPTVCYDQSKTHTPRKQAESHVCDHSDCPMYQKKETIKPYCECAKRQSETIRKVPCQYLQHDHGERRKKCTSVPDDDNKEHIPTKDRGYCYTVNKKKNCRKNTIAMYTSIPPIYPNLYSYNRQSKSCDCKQCECIQCQEASARIIKASRFRTAFDYTTTDVCNCKPCDCQECTRFLTKYKFEQLQAATFKPSNSSIYSFYDNYRCSLCRSELYFGKDYVDLRSVKKGDVLTPAAHQVKVQKLIEEKRKLINTSSGYQKESLSKVSNNYMKFLVDFHNFHKNKENYLDNTFTELKKDISTTVTKSFHRWATSQCDASVQSVDVTTNKPELKNNSTNKTLGSYASMYSSTETASKASMCKENDTVPPFTANSNKSSVSSGSGANHCGYVVQFPKSAVASCIEGVMKSGLEDDLQLFKFNFDPTKQTNILGTRKLYQASDDENVIGASTSTSADAKCGQKNFSDIENDNNANNINTNVAKSSDPYRFKNLKDNLLVKPVITSSETSHYNNSVFRKNSHDECFHMIQSFNHINLNRYINTYNNNDKRILEIDDEVTDIDDYYKKVRKTLNDSKNYTSHLQELLKMYEKENNEFVKISDKLKTTYEPVYNKFKHGNVFVINKKMPTVPEIPRHVPNFEIDDNISTEKVITRNTSYDKPIPHLLERNNLSKLLLKQEFNDEYGKLGTDIEDKIYKHCKDICYDTPEKKPSDVKPNNTPIEVITETANEDLNPVLEHGDTDFSNKKTDNKGIETDTRDMKKGFDCPIHCGVDKEENVCFKPIYVAPKETMTSTSIHTVSSCRPKKKLSYKENKALKQLQNNVRKLVDMAIMHSLNRIDDDSSGIDSSSGMSSISKYNLDSEFSNQFSQPNVQVSKGVWCDNLQLMNELKKQIKDHLKTACMHPLLTSQRPSECMDNMSASSHSCCESKKVRYLMVQKISEHTALVKWSQPREVSNIKGYELLVDGRTVQKILNPSKCIAAVTCLPNSDKILLTIRTLTSATSELGHYPACTIIYRPRVK